MGTIFEGFQTRLSGLYQGGLGMETTVNPKKSYRFKPGYRDCIKGDGWPVMGVTQ